MELAIGKEVEGQALLLHTTDLLVCADLCGAIHGCIVHTQHRQLANPRSAKCDTYLSNRERWAPRFQHLRNKSSAQQLEGLHDKITISRP